MLNGKLGIEKADNGWILSWYETRKSNAVSVEASREVYEDAGECLRRIAEIVGMHTGPAAARALLDAAASSGHVDPATDAEVASLAAPGTPPTVPVGD